MSQISYIKGTKNSMYFITFDGMKFMASSVDNNLDISFDEYLEILRCCGGKHSPKYGWFLPNEEAAIKATVTLSLLQK